MRMAIRFTLAPPPPASKKYEIIRQASVGTGGFHCRGVGRQPCAVPALQVMKLRPLKQLRSLSRMIPARRHPKSGQNDRYEIETFLLGLTTRVRLRGRFLRSQGHNDRLGLKGYARLRALVHLKLMSDEASRTGFESRWTLLPLPRRI